VAWGSASSESRAEERTWQKKKRDRKSEEHQVYGVNLKTIGGNSASYLTARIARDNPAVLEEMKAGREAHE
jgi:hypothetical protein